MLTQALRTVTRGRSQLLRGGPHDGVSAGAGLSGAGLSGAGRNGRSGTGMDLVD